jgi:hypothetical protein
VKTTKKRLGKVRRLMNRKDKDEFKHPLALTKELIRGFCDTFKDCMFIDTACATLGISRDQMRIWSARGQKESKRLNQNPHAKADPKERLYLLWFKKLKRTAATNEVHLVKSLKMHHKEHWQSIAWVLERRYQEHWSQDKKELRRLQRQVEELCQILKEREG